MELTDNKLKRVSFEKSETPTSESSEAENQIELNRSTFSCFPLVTEQRAQYRIPQKISKKATRQSRLEQFWWHTFYEDYLKSVEKSIEQYPMPHSEYNDCYTRELPCSSNQDLINKFPLYGSNTISFYNQDGNKACTFGLTPRITKSVHLQDQQFG